MNKYKKLSIRHLSVLTLMSVISIICMDIKPISWGGIAVVAYMVTDIFVEDDNTPSMG